MVSGSIFDEEDDFVLADGGDTGVTKSNNSARPELQPRPVTNRAPNETQPQTRRDLRAVNTTTRPTLPVLNMETRPPRTLPPAPETRRPPVAPQQQTPIAPRPTPVAPQPQPPVQREPEQYQPQPEWNTPAVQNNPAPYQHAERQPEPQRYVEPTYLHDTPTAVAPVNFPVREPSRELAPMQNHVQPYQQTERPPAPEVQGHNQQSSLYAEETPAPKKKGFGGGKPPAKGRAAKAPREKKPSNFAGRRKTILVVRIIAGIIALVLLGAGVKSIFFPPQFPGQAMVLGAVRSNLGVTAFPAAAGEGFVSSFSREYLTITPKGNSDKIDALKEYTNDTLATSLIVAGDDNAAQTVTQGPIISGVKSVDDTQAIYTVAAEVNGKRWVYFNIPVYYDKTKNGFLISGSPAFIAPPVKAVDPALKSEYTNDTKLANEVTSNIQGFFQAWATSNAEGLGRYMTNDAPETAKIGLNSAYTFVAVSDIRVEAKGPEDAKPNNRKAEATVSWADPANPKITYRQTYKLELFKQPDERWYIANIEGGAAKTSD